MASKKLKILLLFDFAYPPPKDHDYSEYLKSEEFEDDRFMIRTLEKLGHEVEIMGLFDDIESLIDRIKVSQPDLVFNLCEAFKNDRQYEPNIVSLLELLGVKYTGAGPAALRLCKDKGLTKKVLSYHRIRFPHFVISRKSSPIQKLKRLEYPLLVKPIDGEASEGIAQTSFVNNEKDCIERVKFVHEKFESDVIIEEYIEGRELYVSILGNERLTVFPSRELFFKEVPEGEPKFATYKAKWDEAYREKWGIKTGVVSNLPKEVEKEIGFACKKIYRLFEMKGYGRIDFRLKEDGRVYFLEANPNPYLGAKEDFALSAKAGGLGYDQLLERIISLAGV